MNDRRITVVRPSQIFDTFLDEFFNTSGLSTMISSQIDIDMYETDSSVVVKAKAPGYTEDHVNITIEDNVLTIEGKVEDEKKDENKKYHLKEMRSESFIRSITLPSRVDAEKADASFENGVITITLPKLEEVKPKTIAIKTSKK
ncbi:Spore protein SP21 [Patescibacteria group bacterium]|nr:Hsp20/alpha crystallin family protein [Candidatus Dojkabacteria bacterium]CAG1020129.1 Spore protein SP21 [Patescibacteria group bacterium]